MAKKVADSVLDAALAKVATSTNITVCSAEPTNYADITNVNLAAGTVTPGNGNGDFTIANGDTNGRKVTTSQQTDLSIGTSGTATHVALDDGATLLYVTTCTSQALTSGGTVTIPAWDIEIADPT